MSKKTCQERLKRGPPQRSRPQRCPPQRCPWCEGDALYEAYHDREWGVPCHDPLRLFEMINLEGAQAGLSWITILRKRQAYRRLFLGFNPQRLAGLSDSALESIATDPGIVRHRQKVFAVRTNAQAFLQMADKGEPFEQFVWSYVNNRTVQNAYESSAEVPSRTAGSEQMSRDLKRRGFSFVGPTTCYAFMQAAGLVNDHLVSCSRHALLS